jgi:hypothetical protein
MPDSRTAQNRRLHKTYADDHTPARPNKIHYVEPVQASGYEEFEAHKRIVRSEQKAGEFVSKTKRKVNGRRQLNYDEQ